jgi:hypothetical protein
LLEQLRIASPCQADWSQMKGDERVRFCGQCRLNVYNLSGMSRGEAEALVQKAEGRVCVRLWKREDGTVLTRDCPVGIAAIRKLRATVVFATTWVAAALGIAALVGRSSDEGTSVLKLPWERPRPQRVLMGDVWIPPKTMPSPTSGVAPIGTAESGEAH